MGSCPPSRIPPHPPARLVRQPRPRPRPAAVALLALAVAVTVRISAEYGQTMGGSIDVAIRQAMACAEAGADVYKTQLLRPETISRPDAAVYWKDPRPGITQADSFASAGLVPYKDWRHVVDACHDLDILFCAAPFDLPAVEALVDAGCDVLKLASGEITHKALVTAVADTGLPVILSTGAAHEHEIARARAWLSKVKDCTILACTLSYPTPLVAAHLARIETLRARFPLSTIGYSDHVGTVTSALGAAVLGAELLEVHTTLDRSDPSCPDNAMALDPEMLRDYVDAAHIGAKLRGSGTLAPDDTEQAARSGARRGVYARRALVRGEHVTENDVDVLRPYRGGIEPWQLPVTAEHDFAPGDPL